MVEFRDQQVLVLFRPLAFGDIDIGADHALWASIAVVRKKSARLDPPDLAARTNDAILRPVLAPPLSKGLAAECIKVGEIIGMHTGLPIGRDGTFQFSSGKPYIAT